MHSVGAPVAWLVQIARSSLGERLTTILPGHIPHRPVRISEDNPDLSQSLIHQPLRDPNAQLVWRRTELLSVTFLLEPSHFGEGTVPSTTSQREILCGCKDKLALIFNIS